MLILITLMFLSFKLSMLQQITPHKPRWIIFSSTNRWWWTIIRRWMMTGAIIRTQLDVRLTIPIYVLKKCVTSAVLLETSRISLAAHSVENLSTRIVFNWCPLVHKILEMINSILRLSQMRKIEIWSLSSNLTGSVWIANSATFAQVLPKRLFYCIAMCAIKLFTLSVWAHHSKPFQNANGNAKSASNAKNVAPTPSSIR
jgi:hypothetical protein